MNKLQEIMNSIEALNTIEQILLAVALFGVVWFVARFFGQMDANKLEIELVKEDIELMKKFNR